MDIPKRYNVRSLGEYQRSMDTFETAQDGMTLPDVRILLRVDAHRFGPVWESEPDSEYPFGPRFISALDETAKVLMACGLKTSFAFMHGDEVSLLLAEAESNNSRRRSRLISIASSAAAAGFLTAFGKPALFYTKLSELPNPTRVLDYFFWQRKVAMRNFLARTIGLLLVEQGLGDAEIAAKLSPLDESGRRALLAELGRTPDTISDYEQFGLAYWWQSDQKDEVSLYGCRELPADDSDYLQLLGRCLSHPGFSCAESLQGVSQVEISGKKTSPASGGSSNAGGTKARETAVRRPLEQAVPASVVPGRRDVFRIGPKAKR